MDLTPVKVAAVLLGAAALYPAVLIFKRHGLGGYDAKPLGPRLMPTLMLLKAVSFLILSIVSLAGVTGDSDEHGTGDALHAQPWFGWVQDLGGQRSTWPVAGLGAAVVQIFMLLLVATSPEAYGGVPGWASASKSDRPWQVALQFILWFSDIGVPHELMFESKITTLPFLRGFVSFEKAVIMTGAQQTFGITAFGGSALNDAGVGYSIGAIMYIIFQAITATSLMTDHPVESPYCFLIAANFMDCALKSGLSGGFMNQEPKVVRGVLFASVIWIFVGLGREAHRLNAF